MLTVKYIGPSEYGHSATGGPGLQGEIIRLLYVQHLDLMWGPQLPIQCAPETHSSEVRLYN